MNTTPISDALEKRWNQTFVPLTQEGIDACRDPELKLATANERIKELDLLVSNLQKNCYQNAELVFNAGKQNAELSAALVKMRELLLELKAEVDRNGKAPFNGTNFEIHFRNVFQVIELMRKPLNEALSLTPILALKEYLGKTIALIEMFKCYANKETNEEGDTLDRIGELCDKELSRLTGDSTDK